LGQIKKGRVRRVQVTFTEEQWDLIERFRGIIGREDAEIVRNIVLAWLAEKSIIAEEVKKSLYQEASVKGGSRASQKA
jgi:hypothetical protein